MRRAALVWVQLGVGALTAGCGQGDPAPNVLGQSLVPAVAFLIHNEAWSMRLDGTDRRALGRVGENKYRTGWPRYLPDGRLAVLGDDTGAIFPYVAVPGEGLFQRLPQMNVTVNDSLCGVTVEGSPRLIFTETPFIPTRTVLHRVDVDDQVVERVEWEPNGVLFNPSPYADGYVLAARTLGSQTRIEILYVGGRANQRSSAMPIATIRAPYYAASPVRLPDGRVVFLRIDARQEYVPVTGDLWVIPAGGGAPEPTGITDVIAVTVAGDQLVYEAAGGDGVSDLSYTDLVRPPVNITRTPYVSEHLGWSD